MFSSVDDSAIELHPSYPEIYDEPPEAEDMIALPDQPAPPP